MKYTVMVMLIGIHLHAQTRVDLASQSKNIDFSAANSTKPLKSGPTLPVACGSGELFLLVSQGPAPQIYICSNDTWSDGGSNAVTVDLNGSNVASGKTINLVAVTGVIAAVSTTGSQINVQTAIDTALVQTQAGAQAGTALLCASLSASQTAYTCSLTPQATSYAVGMALNWRPDISGAGNPVALNVNNLGTVPVKLADGITDPPAGGILAGQLYSIWYDGQVFRLPSAGSGASGCTLGTAGYVWPFGPPEVVAAGPNPGALIPRAHQFQLSCAMTLNSVSYNIATATGCTLATCNLVFAVYDASLNLIGASRITPVSGPGPATAVWNNAQTLQAGVTYYLAWLSDSNVIQLNSLASWDFGMLMNQVTTRAGIGVNRGTGSGGTLAAPPALGSITARSDGYGVPPEVLFQ
jgi:hypothetical protein